MIFDRGFDCCDLCAGCLLRVRGIVLSDPTAEHPSLARIIMVEEIVSGTRPAKTRTERPKYIYLWTINDVQKWLRRHCSDLYSLYSDNFLQHEITGSALIRVNENTLKRMGITNAAHRQEIWREIMKLSLKTAIMEIRDLETQNNLIYGDYN